MSEIPPRPIGAAAAGRPRRAPAPLTPTRSREPRWAAWSSDLSRIVAYGATLEEARDNARAMGEMEPALEPVQRSNRQA